MTIAQRQRESFVTGWGGSLLVCRVLLAALLICVGSVSSPTVSRPPVEYSRSQGDGFQSSGQIESIFYYGRGAIASAHVAAREVDDRATFAVARPVYEFAKSSFVRNVALHNYEAIGPPTTDISQPA